MKKFQRIFVIVMDSLGIGAMPDSELLRLDPAFAYAEPPSS